MDTHILIFIFHFRYYLKSFEETKKDNSLILSDKLADAFLSVRSSLKLNRKKWEEKWKLTLSIVFRTRTHATSRHNLRFS